ncbi:SLC13 family permease [Candidatus Spyradosoma sp. SGI.093]|uniref:SLC13 family permease n=1 Tax=Candidatus Spyradosoma sp. SGI.093 TaxID=3420583 RepID=UPI003D0195AB
MNKAKFVKAVIAIALAVGCLFLPYESLGLVGAHAVNAVEIRVIAIFVLAALFWILEPFPIWTTSMLVIVLMLLTVSDKALMFSAGGDTLFSFQTDPATGEKFANLVNYKGIMATFADPIIMLFLGGFFLAAAATKYKLDMNLARFLLKPFGTNPKFVLLGLMAITALFSMFMSNTATAAMMLAILAPVLSLFDEDDKGRAAFALAIPIAANVGGMGTPIGTPPNAIALKALGDMNATVSFGKWMAFGIPYVIILILAAWALLLWMFPISKKKMELNVGGEFLKTPKAIIVYVTFAVTVLLWVLGKDIVGIDSNMVAMIPMAVFALTQVITKKDLNGMSWDVLWLVAGGFALGLGLQKTGLAAHLIGAIPFDTWPAFGLMVGAGVICLFMANFMSHTATASLLVPIIAVVGVNVGASMDALGGVVALLVSVAFASSLGMALPISTPPNALAHATGLVDTKGMAKTGVIIGLLGMLLTYAMMILLAYLGVFTPIRAEGSVHEVAAEKVSMLAPENVEVEKNGEAHAVPAPPVDVFAPGSVEKDAPEQDASASAAVPAK